jgi:Protein of unknown function (DUF3010)
MRILGVDINSTEATLCLVEFSPNGHEVVDVKPTKVPLSDSAQQDSIRSFGNVFKSISTDHAIDLISIRGRNDKGGYSSSGVTFKMEGAIQIMTDVECAVIPYQTINAKVKKISFSIPDSINKYQHDAYLSAIAIHAIRTKK